MLKAQTQTQTKALGGACAWLEQEFSRRQRRNRYYSKRAFARDVGISPALLSLVLRGKRIISHATARRICDHLKVSESERGRYLSLLSEQLLRAQSHELVEPREVVDAPTFEILGTWIHYAILGLGNVADCKSDPEWIAERLGIGTDTVKLAMEELISFDKIELVGGSFRPKGPNLDSGVYTSSGKQRRLMQDLLHKAEASLEKDPLATRCFRTLTCALSSGQLESARHLIEEMLDKFEAKLCHQKGERVYTLGVYLVPIDKVTEARE